jgi:hypothetical protein
MQSAYYVVHQEIIQISIEGIRCPIGNQCTAKLVIPERTNTLLVLLLTGLDKELNFEEISLLSYIYLSNKYPAFKRRNICLYFKNGYIPCFRVILWNISVLFPVVEQIFPQG